MSGFRVYCTRLSDGRVEELEHLLSLDLTRSLDSPAEGMRCTAAVAGLPPDYGEIRVEGANSVLFRGQTDRRSFSLSGEGMLLELEARSQGGLLLDNEAAPCVLANVRMQTIYNLFAKPYGFTLENTRSAGMLSMYTVGKGLSEWEALENYVRRVYNLTPTVEGTKIRIGRPNSPSLLELGGSGLPFARLEYVDEPCRILSKVVLRDEEGRYNTAVHNSSAAYYKVQRKRYIIPANEYADNPGLDANQRIRRSMLDKEKVAVRLPGIADVRPGREAAVRESLYAKHNLLVRESRLRMDATGVYTLLTLVSSVYWE